jgi:hypothetical protein
MIRVGSFVKFNWWSNYRAPSMSLNDDGRSTWHELQPGTTGVVLCTYDDDEHVVVLFSTVDTLLKVHKSMLELVT